MYKKAYPMIGDVSKITNITRLKCKCGEKAEFIVTIRYNCFRGDDELMKACSSHKKDIEFLTGK